jgi:large subunit ribosomal protein L14
MQQRYLKGSVHRGLIIRTKVLVRRVPGVSLKFEENAVVLITRNTVPVSNRVYGPVLREMCKRWPSLGCVCLCMI